MFGKKNKQLFLLDLKFENMSKPSTEKKDLLDNRQKKLSDADPAVQTKEGDKNEKPELTKAE
jgi:hypothetical protein